MKYLEKITIVDNTYHGTHVLDKGFEIECSDVNLFVGDQGCGKSTLLNLIQKNHSDILVKLSEYTLNNGVETFFFDSERGYMCWHGFVTPEEFKTTLEERQWMKLTQGKREFIIQRRIDGKNIKKQK